MLFGTSKCIGGNDKPGGLRYGLSNEGWCLKRLKHNEGISRIRNSKLQCVSLWSVDRMRQGIGLVEGSSAVAGRSIGSLQGVVSL